MIIGIGTDIVAVARLEKALSSAPSLRARLFLPAERDLPTNRLAGRFAAKEAVAKALGSPGTLSWHDVLVTNDEAGKPGLELFGASKTLAMELGVTAWHISVSHDGGFALAYVVAEAL